MKFKFDRTKGLGGSDAHKIWWGYDIARLWSIKTNTYYRPYFTKSKRWPRFMGKPYYCM